MPLVIKDGKILLDTDKLALHEDCCCPTCTVPCCDETRKRFATVTFQNLEHNPMASEDCEGECDCEQLMSQTWELELEGDPGSKCLWVLRDGPCGIDPRMILEPQFNTDICDDPIEFKLVVWWDFAGAGQFWSMLSSTPKPDPFDCEDYWSTVYEFESGANNTDCCRCAGNDCAPGGVPLIIATVTFHN
jgi:hypothetical protein